LPFPHRRAEPLDGAAIRDVAGDPRDAVFSADRLRGGLRPLLVAAGDDDNGHFTRDCYRSRQTDATAATGHKGDLTCISGYRGTSFRSGAIGDQPHLVGRPLARRSVGSTLLLKGLEAEVSVLLNADNLNARNLYVAMFVRPHRCSIRPSELSLPTPRVLEATISTSAPWS
jgi:hypothetical protein